MSSIKSFPEENQYLDNILTFEVISHMSRNQATEITATYRLQETKTTLMFQTLGTTVHTQSTSGYVVSCCFVENFIFTRPNFLMWPILPLEQFVTRHTPKAVSAVTTCSAIGCFISYSQNPCTFNQILIQY